MPKEKKFNFTKAFEELEQITDWFESEKIDLEEGLNKFERGLELSKNLSNRLSEVENKVQEIKEKFSDLFDDNQPSEEDFEEE